MVLREEFEEIVETDREMRRAAKRLSSRVSVYHANRQPKVDLKLVTGDEWETCEMFFFQNVRKDLVGLCL